MTAPRIRSIQNPVAGLAVDYATDAADKGQATVGTKVCDRAS
jgi:hypothetical protein